MSKEQLAEVFCYGLLPSEMADPSRKKVTPIIIEAGKYGYHLTDWEWTKEYAQSALDTINARLGITPDMADRLMLASMGGGVRTRDED